MHMKLKLYHMAAVTVVLAGCALAPNIAAAASNRHSIFVDGQQDAPMAPSATPTDFGGRFEEARIRVPKLAKCRPTSGGFTCEIRMGQFQSGEDAARQARAQAEAERARNDAIVRQQRAQEAQRAEQERRLRELDRAQRRARTG